METARDMIINYMEIHSKITIDQRFTTFTTNEIADNLFIERSSVSRVLNTLTREGVVEKIKGKPVLFHLNYSQYAGKRDSFHSMIGHGDTLSEAIQLVKAALLYPNAPIPILIKGPSGSGRHLMAESICNFALDQSISCSRDDFKLIDYTIKPISDYEHLLESNSINIYIADEPYKSNAHDTAIMEISMPALSNYTLEERFQLVKLFLLDESQKIKRNLQLHANLLALFLTYQCTYNIRQLKNDIHLSCAKAYADYVNKEGSVIIMPKHLSSEILKGMFRYTSIKTDLIKLLHMNRSYLFEHLKGQMVISESSEADNISAVRMLSKLNSPIAKENVLPVAALMTGQRYDLADQILSDKQLERKIGRSLYLNAKQFIEDCKNTFNHIYSVKDFYAVGLFLHDLLNNNLNSEFNSDQLSFVMTRYQDAYKFVQAFLMDLEREYRIDTSISDAALLCLIAVKVHQDVNASSHPGILILMHGDGTAKNMSTVVNTLLSAPITHAYDMPLDESLNTAFNNVVKIVSEIDQGHGVIILSDMGALSFFGSIISKEMNIKTRTLEMTSTPIALECAQKATNEKDIDIIYNDLKHYSTHNINFQASLYKMATASKDKVIVTICLTGEGSAIKLKNMIESSAVIDSQSIDIIPLSILNHTDALKRIEKISQKRNILAIVGTINPNIHNIPFISIDKMLMNDNFTELAHILQTETTQAVVEETIDINPIENVHSFLVREILAYDYSLIQEPMTQVIDVWEKTFNKTYSIDKKIGLIVHTASALENMLMGRLTASLENEDLYLKAYDNEISMIEQSMKTIEKTLSITLPKPEVIYLLILLLELEL